MRNPIMMAISICFMHITGFEVLIRCREATIHPGFITTLLLQSPGHHGRAPMQMLHHGEYTGESSVMFLPMIDLDPSDPSCIYTTMKFVSSQARRYDATPILTFDQPLYWKALTIIPSQPDDSDLKDMLLRLGGFHIQMSFLGSIGHLMAGSGLQELLEVVFTGNAVRHMLTGKAIPRAVRGHILVDAALNTILVAKAYHIPLQTKETDEPKRDTASTDPENYDVEIGQQKQGTVDVTSDIAEAKYLYDRAMLSILSVEEVCSAGVLVRIKGKLCDLKQTMTTRTAMLCLQYMDMVSILQRFIKAERIANWKHTFKQYKTCCHISQHLVIHSMQSLHTYTYKSCYVGQKLRTVNSWKDTMW